MYIVTFGRLKRLPAAKLTPENLLLFSSLSGYAEHEPVYPTILQ